MAGVLGSGPGGLILGAETKTAAAKGPIVNTTLGKLRGYTNNRVQCFKGIPYGASTAGDKRFLAPSKAAPWMNVREAVELGHRSPQQPAPGEIPEVGAMDRREERAEDCLVLNVWTNSSKGTRPVMVWMHGGGYTSGSGGWIMWDGENLARKQDVVVVTLNHRLNAFGYLYLAGFNNEKYASASNIGMLDIVMALEWVRDNIDRFGGDPKNVTIFGQSGGGGKVSTLLGMPAAKGLFHKAIVQSGSLVRGTPVEAAMKSSETLLAKFNLKPNQLDNLQRLPMDQIVMALRETQGLRLAPVLDGKTLPAGPFDPAAPEVSGAIPLMMGSVATEATFFNGTPLDPIDDADLRRRTKQYLRGDDAAVERVIAAYRKDDPNLSNLDVYQQMATDGSRQGVITEAERKFEQGKAPVYMYYFNWKSPVREGKLKAFHCIEVPFVFQNVDECKIMTGDGKERYALADKVSLAWANFARTGNPNHSGLPKWPAYDTAKRETMVLDVESRITQDPGANGRKALLAERKTA